MKSITRKKLEGRLVGGNFADLANYSDLFERTHDCILILDPTSFEILQCNPACEATLGVSTSDLVGNELPSFFDEFTSARLGAFLAQVPKTSIDLSWSSTKTHVTLELSISQLEIADYCSVLQLIARDVTAIRAQQRRLESLSVTDELTGLNNRRAFNEHLDKMHSAAERNSTTYAVVLFDVDSFKHFNDRNGHSAGDVALQEIGKILNAQKSPEVFPARYGGEEFVLVIQSGDPSHVHSLVEQIRATVQRSVNPHAQHQPLGFLSVSIGVAFWKKGLTFAAVIERADEALYESKEMGRNRITISKHT